MGNNKNNLPVYRTPPPPPPPPPKKKHNLDLVHSLALSVVDGFMKKKIECLQRGVGMDDVFHLEQLISDKYLEEVWISQGGIGKKWQDTMEAGLNLMHNTGKTEPEIKPYSELMRTFFRTHKNLPSFSKSFHRETACVFLQYLLTPILGTELRIQIEFEAQSAHEREAVFWFRKRKEHRASFIG